MICGTCHQDKHPDQFYMNKGQYRKKCITCYKRSMGRLGPKKEEPIVLTETAAVWATRRF